MIRVSKRALALLLVFALTLTLLSGCGKPQGAGDQASAESAGDQASAESAGDQASAESTTTSGYTRAESSEDYARAIAKKNQEFNFEDAEIVEVSENLPAKAKNYTIMVYMIGSNLESANGAASADIREMLDSGIDFTDTNLILYTGGSQRWTSEIPCDRNCVIDVSLAPEVSGQTSQEQTSPSQRGWVVASTAKNADMGASQTLSEFVNFTLENYPAEHYALILWDHGGGPLWGYGSDELFYGDGLLLEEMRQAMEETPFATNHPASRGQKLEFVGFDACLMGSVENMFIWQEYANYYVGSEELEPGDGWDYHFLSIFNKTDDPAAITSAIVDAYGAYYEAKQSEYYHPDCTLSAADLSKLPAVKAALDALGQALAENVEAGAYAKIRIAREAAKSFGVIGSEEDRSLLSYDLVDVHDLAGGLSEMVGAEAAGPNAEGISSWAEALRAAADALIIKNYSNIDGAGGVSVYFPSSNKTQYFEMREVYEGLNMLGFSRFFDVMSRAWQNAEKRTCTIPAPTLAGGEYRIQLDPAFFETVAKVTYTILQKGESGMYTPLLTGCRADVDESGLIRLPMDPSMIVLTTGDDFTLWSVAQVEATETRVIYRTRNTRLRTSATSTFLRDNTKTDPITIILAEDVASGALKIQTVNGSSENALFSGKETIDVSNYDGIHYFNETLIPTLSESGDLLPVSDWEEGDLTSLNLQILGDSFGFALKPLSECGITDTYYVLTIEDVYGVLYTAAPQKIEPDLSYTFKTVPTESGSMTFAVYQNEAHVTDYQGTDTQIEIPETVDGVPVTAVGPLAFKGDTGGDATPVLLKKVILPSTIQTIGGYAFYYLETLEEITLPEGLRTIGDSAFGVCRALSAIELPSTLTYIGDYAFHKCTSLTSITLPGGIRHIGKGAFMGMSSLEEIQIEGGGSASGGTDSRSADGTYEVVDGVLYDQVQKVLLACPPAKTGTVTVEPGTKVIGADAFSYGALFEVILPEGLAAIENYAFYHCLNLALPAFPDSLERIGHFAFACDWFTLDIPAGGEAADSGEDAASDELAVIHIGHNVRFIGEEAFTLFTVRAFEVDPDNPRFSAAEGSLMNKNGDALIAFAWNADLTLIVPEGCVTFNLGEFDELMSIISLSPDTKWQVYIPDSVIRIPGATLNSYKVVFHCSEGSMARTVAEQNGITVSE